MTAAKNTRSRASMTPLMIWLKCVRKLNEATASTAPRDMRSPSIDTRNDEPPTVNRKQTAMVSTKAMTWLLPRADRQVPVAREPPAQIGREVGRGRGGQDG